MVGGGRAKEHHGRAPVRRGEVGGAGIGGDHKRGVCDEGRERAEGLMSRQDSFLAETCEGRDPDRSRPFCGAARKDHVMPGQNQFRRDFGEAVLGPEAASVRGSGMNHCRGRPVRPGRGPVQPEVTGVGLDAVPLQQPRPPLTLVDIVFPERAGPPTGSMGNDPLRPEGLDPGLALRAPSVQVDRDIHPARRQGQRDVEAMGGEQFVAPDQGKGVPKPVLGGVEQPMRGVRPAQGMKGRYSDEQIAELQRPQHQHHRAAVL